MLLAFSPERANHGTPEAISPKTARAASFLGGHFLLNDGHFRAILHSLPPIVHLRRQHIARSCASPWNACKRKYMRHSLAGR
jgi:hypothetical protein